MTRTCDLRFRKTSFSPKSIVLQMCGIEGPRQTFGPSSSQTTNDRFAPTAVTRELISFSVFPYQSRTGELLYESLSLGGRTAPQVRFERSKGRSLAVARRSFFCCRSRSRRSDRNSVLARYLRQRQSFAFIGPTFGVVVVSGTSRHYTERSVGIWFVRIGLPLRRLLTAITQRGQKSVRMEVLGYLSRSNLLKLAYLVLVPGNSAART
jgi:hypothetical protein